MCGKTIPMCSEQRSRKGSIDLALHPGKHKENMDAALHGSPQTPELHRRLSEKSFQCFTRLSQGGEATEEEWHNHSLERTN